MVGGALLAFFRPEPPTKSSHPVVAGLTFAERVTYQRRIEEVYWRHRIWPKENPKPKPSLAEVMSAQRIEKKVEDLSPRLASAGKLAEVDHSQATASRDGAHGLEHKTAGSPAGIV